MENITLSVTKLFKKSDIESLQAEKVKIEQKIHELETLKRSLIGFTAELYGNKKINEYYIFSTLYKNRELTEKYFTEEGFGNLEDSELSDLVDKYNEKMTNFEEKNIQKIALSGFFINYFYLCGDSPYNFFGKPVAFLTNNQVNLFHNGLKFKNIVSEMRDKVNTETLNDPEKLLAAYNEDKNIEEIISKSGGDKDNINIGIVGATKEQRQKIADRTGAKIVSYKEIAKQKGKGKLTFQELMELENNS